MTRDEPPTSAEVWFDGACALCARSKIWCEQRDLSRRLRFRDFRSSSESELPVERVLLERSLWLRCADGAMLEGYGAWREILTLLPRWRWLAVLAGLPPFSWAGPPLYRFIARSRRRFIR